MRPGTQKEVLTPGQNQKHYLAGALHTRTGPLGRQRPEEQLPVPAAPAPPARGLSPSAETSCDPRQLRHSLQQAGAARVDRGVRRADRVAFSAALLAEAQSHRAAVARTPRQCHAQSSVPDPAGALAQRRDLSSARVAVPGHEGLVDPNTQTASGLIRKYRTIFEHCCDHSESWGAI